MEDGFTPVYPHQQIIQQVVRRRGRYGVGSSPAKSHTLIAQVVELSQGLNVQFDSGALVVKSFPVCESQSANHNRSNYEKGNEMHDYTKDVVEASLEFEDWWRKEYPEEEPYCEVLKRLFEANKALRKARGVP